MRRWGLYLHFLNLKFHPRICLVYQFPCVYLDTLAVILYGFTCLQSVKYQLKRTVQILSVATEIHIKVDFEKAADVCVPQWVLQIEPLFKSLDRICLFQRCVTAYLDYSVLIGLGNNVSVDSHFWISLCHIVCLYYILITF